MLMLIACDDGAAGSSDGDAETTDGDGQIVCANNWDCPTGQYCGDSGYCVPYDENPQDGDAGCSSDEDCPDGQTCDLRDKICVEELDTDGDSDSTEDDGEELEIRCDDHLPCTEDSVVGEDCQFSLREGYCLIEETCYTADVKKPGDVCLACRPGVADDAWSAVDDGALCDDSLVCTTADACHGGVCEGAVSGCDDSVACTDDICVEPGGCQNTPNDDNCEPGQFCETTGCTAAGCENGALRCVGDELQECQGGEYEAVETCALPTPVCTLEGCAECAPGAAYCEGPWLNECNADGIWEASYCLGPAPACISGECVPCDNGDLWCGHAGDEDWGIYECVGGAWSLLEDCEGATPMCGDLGQGDGLQCLECPPNATRCDGLSHQVCDETGIWRIDPCPTSIPYCESGACVVCPADGTRCGGEGENPNDVYVCIVETQGRRWQFDHACPLEAPNCTNGHCGVCEVGETRCSPTNPQGTEICEDGLWTNGPDCENGQYCDTETGLCTDGWSLYFAGDQRMEIPDDNAYDPNAEFTLEAWIFPTALSGNCDTGGNAILEKWAVWPVGTYLLAVCADFYGRPNVARFFAITDQDKQDFFNSSNNSIKVGQWNHIAVVWSDQWMDMFVNGNREVHRANLIGWKTPNTFQQNVLAVGQLDEWTEWGFKGYIDEVRISKIRRYDGATYTPAQRYLPDEFTTGLWHLDDFITPNECLDSSGHHDGVNTFGAIYSEYGVGETPP